MKHYRMAIVLLPILAGSCATQPAKFENAHEECAVSSPHITVEDEGESLIFDGPSQDEPQGSFYEDLACLLGELDTPAAVRHQMDNTTSLMGLREGKWDDIQASWSFHPDNGFDLVLELVEEE